MTEASSFERTSVPPPPQRPSSHGVLIALLVLALIIVSAVAALIYGARMIARHVSIREERTVSGNKEVSIKTPVGDINVNQGAQVDPALLGLPLYPGARRVEDRHSARVNMDFPGHQAMDLITARFETPDSIEKVESYYRSQLRGQISKTTTSDFGRKITFEVKRDEMEKVVSLKATANETAITLLRIRHGTAEAN